ncbi:MAG TPA: glycosyltransferase family 4 protein [Dongiaceae bacterium]
MIAPAINKEPVRIAYLVSHPIQYQSPLLRLIAAEPGLSLKAFYRSPMGLKPYTDEGFGQTIAWDTPLLDGFEHEFLPALDDPMRVTRYLRPLNYGLAKRLRQGRFNVLWVHGYARVFNLGAMLTAKRLGLKVMLRDEATPISMPRGPAKKIAKRAFFAGLWTLVDAALAIGSLNRRYYREQGFRADRIFSVPYAVDNQRFQSGAKAAAPNRNAFLPSLGIPADRPRIVFSGKLTPIKAPEILLEAFARLGDPWPSLCFVGDGPLRAMLSERARDLGVAERVFFAGFRNQGELPAFYDLADVFVLPSRREPWGLVVNEAMNAGRAIVVSDQVGSGPDLVRPGENGSIVPVNDVDRLAAALAEALSSPAQTAALGRRSLEIIDGWGFREDIAGLKQALAGIGLPCVS